MTALYVTINVFYFLIIFILCFIRVLFCATDATVPCGNCQQPVTGTEAD